MATGWTQLVCITTPSLFMEILKIRHSKLGTIKEIHFQKFVGILKKTRKLLGCTSICLLHTCREIISIVTDPGLENIQDQSFFDLNPPGISYIKCTLTNYNFCSYQVLLSKRKKERIYMQLPNKICKQQ